MRWPYTSYPSTGSWSLDHVGAFPANNTPAQAMGFFPDLNNGIGGLVFASTATTENMRIWATTNAGFDSWTELNSNVFTDVSVEYLITYLPGQKWMLFGGGKVPFAQGFGQRAPVEPRDQRAAQRRHQPQDDLQRRHCQFL